MRVGFIGLGNAGSKLAGTLIRNGIETFIHDLNLETAGDLIKLGGKWTTTLSEVGKKADIIITCLPSPETSAEVIEKPGGILENIGPEKIWIEMSTTSASEVIRLSKRFKEKNVMSADCPVSGGCHKADSGNISIFAGCDRIVFKKIQQILFVMGRKVLHTGTIGTASHLKVMTNFLATTNLIACCEALVTMKASDIDLAIAYEAIKISSGNSFVHETESQVILNGSRDINFTLDLVLKDIGLFQSLAEKFNIPLKLSPLLNKIIKDGIAELGSRANSPSIISLLEQQTGLSILAQGFPSKIEDSEPEEAGYEVIPKSFSGKLNNV